ncbi:MAG: DUF3160 domain-containing protein [Vulcanimicrobiota bacterium]
MLGCQAEPRLAKLTPYQLSPPLTEVEGLQPLEARAELAENACWLGPGEHLDFYEAYLLNPAPFITSDSLFHAYQSLLNDTLVEFHGKVRDPLEERLKNELGLPDLGEPLPFESDEQLARCVALSNKLRASPDWQLYERIRRLDLELAGSADDPGPESFLAGRPPVVAPRVVDRGVPVEGMRIMPQGLTLKNLAFQAVFSNCNDIPEGNDIAFLLGHPSLDLDPDRQSVLRDSLQAHDSIYQDTILALASLSHHGPGYPSFMDSSVWQRKTLNTQLGGWAELEHTLDRATKDNSYYMGGTLKENRFSGYVEPAPEFFQRMQMLTKRTRQALVAAGVFETMAELQVRQKRELKRAYRARSNQGSSLDVESMSYRQFEQFFGRGESVPTEADFLRLESLCGQLAEMAWVELEDQPFSHQQLEFLANYGEELKALSLNRTNIAHPPQPAGVLTPIASELSTGTQRYAGSGRPLRLVVIVPYQGRLYWSEGAVYSYYEFDRPMDDPVPPWKEWMELPFEQQPVRSRGIRWADGNRR